LLLCEFILRIDCFNWFLIAHYYGFARIIYRNNVRAVNHVT
jgi:hypothetical protein